MGRKSIPVETLHGFSIEDLQQKLSTLKSIYEHNVLQAVIMRYQGISTPLISKSLGKCSATIIEYIKDWNVNGIDSLKDNRGGNIPSKLTDDIMDDIKNIIINNSPKDFGYDYNNWNLSLIAKYIEDNHGSKFSKTWMSKLLRNLGFTYKRGTFQPSLADELMQLEFKKNVHFNGLY